MPQKQTDNLNDMILHYRNVRYLIYKDKEFITPDELYNMGVGLCSSCGKESLHEHINCPKCGTRKFVLKESTIASLKK